MSVRKVKQIIAVKVTGYIELPQKDVKAAAHILNTFVAAQDSGDYSELFKMLKIEKVDANQVRRTFEEPDVVENHELTPIGAIVNVAVPKVGEREAEPVNEVTPLVRLDDGTLLDAQTGEVVEEEEDFEPPKFLRA